MLIEGYPKEVTLLDNQKVTLKPMIPGDRDPLVQFFQMLSPEDKLYMREDTSNPSVIQKWVDELDYDVILPILAWLDDRVVADASLNRTSFGWSPHVGEIRMLVDPVMRKKGLGTLMAKEIFHLALQSGLDKIIVQTMGEQERVRKIFLDLGFTMEATLKAHVKDLSGRKHDLVIVSHDVEEMWNRMADMSGQFGHAQEY